MEDRTPGAHLSQKEEMRRTEEAHERLLAEVEREQHAQRSLKTERCMYESLLSYQQELQRVMETANLEVGRGPWHSEEKAVPLVVHGD
jgi:hypothetical protein